MASQVRACHPVKNFIPGAPYLPAASPEAGKTCCRDGDAGSHRASAAITMAHHLASAAYNRPALLKASLLRHSTNILGAYRGTRTGALGSSEDKSITLRRQSSPRKMLALFGTCLQRARFWSTRSKREYRAPNRLKNIAAGAPRVKQDFRTSLAGDCSFDLKLGSRINIYFAARLLRNWGCL